MAVKKYRTIKESKRKGEQNPAAKLSESDVKEILADETSSVAELAKRYGVARQTIYNLYKGNSWSHLHEF